MDRQVDQNDLFNSHFRCGLVKNLNSASSVLMYSSFIQRSVSFLDLSTCISSKNRKLIPTWQALLKQKCPRREILDRLSLDLPCALEKDRSLCYYTAMINSTRSPFKFSQGSPFGTPEVPTDFSDCNPCNSTKSEQFYVTGFYIESEVYTRDLESYIILNIKQSANRFKTMKRYIEIWKFHFFRIMFWDYERIGELYEFCMELLVMYDGFGSDLKDLLMICRASFDSFLNHQDNDQIVRKILQITFSEGLEPWSPKTDPINTTLLWENLMNLIPLIEYGNVPLFSKNIEEDFRKKINSSRVRSILQSVTDNDVKKLNRIPIDASVGSELVRNRDHLTQERLNILVYQLLIFLVCYKTQSNINCRKILRLYWRTLKYPLLRRRDIDDSVSQYFPTEVLDKVWIFYVSSVDLDGFGTPRSLLHLSRSKCRSVIRVNYMLPIAEEVCPCAKLTLPKEMFNYLRLQC